MGNDDTGNKSFDSVFAKEVRKGLTSEPKYLSSKFFYDEKGDSLFQEIMKLPEYYLTRTELEVLKENKHLILSRMLPSDHFDLIDLGAGDGLKTKVLLKFFTEQRLDFTYIPVDISGSAIEQLTRNIIREFPGISITGISQPFSQALHRLAGHSKKLILFLGSSIGNFTFEESVEFFTEIRQKMKEGDYLLIGFDLRKDPDIILDAYNDKSGVTRRFNLNLLERINRELRADFDLDKFKHCPKYDSHSGEARSFLQSTIDQNITIKNLDLKVRFCREECIRTEISKKYSFSEIQALAQVSGFQVEQNFTDSKNWFAISLWKMGSKLE